MRADLEALRLRMEAAADALDFEEASRLRDRLSLLRGQPEAASSPEMDTARLARQQPDAMGLGTSDQKATPPPGWTPPRRPDPMTSGHKTRRGRR
ncbi:MAG: UvrB/UvrC motif-containing protein [Caulobacteraceae bacterium]|nr:UvrB/UvrC motif-containing protein [Caulobacter sp.]